VRDVKFWELVFRRQRSGGPQSAAPDRLAPRRGLTSS